MRAAGKSFAAFEAALDDDPELAAWKTEKGLAHDKRELRRAWDRAPAYGWQRADLPLITDDTFPAVPLPFALFPDIWSDWIRQAAKRAGAPPDFVACFLLSVVGAAIGNACVGSPWEGWVQASVINVACVGLPSAGKSPAMDAVVEPLAELEKDLNNDWEERRSQYQTELQFSEESRDRWKGEVKNSVRGKAQSPPPMPAEARESDEPHRRRIVTADLTVDAAVRLSANNPRGMCLYRDELAGFLTGMGRYGGNAASDRAFWLQTYDGKRWTSDRVKDGNSARPIPHLTWAISRRHPARPPRVDAS
jgi:hypothetical protein